MPSLVLPVLTSLPDEQPVLVGGELELRPWRGSDAPVLVAAYADPAVQHWHGQRLDEAEAEAYADEWGEHWRAGRSSLLHDDGWHDMHLHARLA